MSFRAILVDAAGRGVGEIMTDVKAHIYTAAAERGCTAILVGEYEQVDVERRKNPRLAVPQAPR